MYLNYGCCAKVFASYYIVYVGIVVASVTAPAYEKLAIGSAAFWFGFVTLILLLILVTYRYVTVKEVPDPAKPLICILCGTDKPSLIAGYVQSVMPKSYGFLMGMFVVATVIYIFALVKAIGYLKMPFFLKLCGIHLPICHQCDRSKQMMACAMNMGHPMPFLKYVVLIETIIAGCSGCVYVYSFYGIYLWREEISCVVEEKECLKE